jgi:hypothetical protein
MNLDPMYSMFLALSCIHAFIHKYFFSIRKIIEGLSQVYVKHQRYGPCKNEHQAIQFQKKS